MAKTVITLNYQCKGIKKTSARRKEDIGL